MKTVSKKYLKEFVHACKKTASYGLIKCSSGNLSKKIDKDHMLITPTRIWLSDIKPSDIVIIRISDGCVINGAPRTYVRGTFQPAFALRASGEVRPAQNPPLRHLDEAEDILVHSSPDLHPGSSVQADKLILYYSPFPLSCFISSDAHNISPGKYLFISSSFLGKIRIDIPD